MKKELSIEELTKQGYEFYNWEEASQKFNVNLTERRNRKKNIERNIEGKYEYQDQKKKKVKGEIVQEAGIWIKESDNIFIGACKTTKSLENFETLLDFYLNNHVDYLTVAEIVELTGTNKQAVESFEKHCREIGLMEEKTKPTYQEVFNQYTGNMEKREVSTMTQYYYVSINGQNGKLATSKEYFNKSWNWIYKRAGKLSKEFLKKKPQYIFVTEEVYNGFKKQAQAEFSNLFGHKVRKGNTREINIEKLLELGINKNINREPLPTEKTYKAEVNDFNVIENDVYDIVESHLTVVQGFGRQAKFDAQILESSVIDGSFLIA